MARAFKINRKQVTSKPKDFNAEYPRHCVALDAITAHCERFNRTLQDELLDDNLYDLKDIDGFNKKMGDDLFWHHVKRPHYLLGQILPIEYIKMNEKNAICYGRIHMVDNS